MAHSPTMMIGHIPLDATADTFLLGGVIVAARPSTAQDFRHLALVLVVDAWVELAQVLVPADVWPTSRELLVPGQMVGIYGKLEHGAPDQYDRDGGSAHWDRFYRAPRRIATELTLQETRH